MLQSIQGLADSKWIVLDQIKIDFTMSTRRVILSGFIQLLTVSIFYLVGCCLTKNWLKARRVNILAAHLPPRLNSKHTVAEKPWHKIQRIPIRDIAPLLEFVPSNPLPQNYNGQNFQTIRRLSISDQQLIQDEWDIWME